MTQTPNPKAVIEPDTFTVRRTIHINAPLDKVWRAVTEPDLISQWFGQITLSGSGAGALGSIGWPGNHRVPIRVDTYNPKSEVSYRWCNEEGPLSDTVDDERSTTFTFTLDERPDGTQLTVVESGFDRVTDPTGLMNDHRGGWDTELDKLIATLESAA